MGEAFGVLGKPDDVLASEPSAPRVANACALTEGEVDVLTPRAATTGAGCVPGVHPSAV